MIERVKPAVAQLRRQVGEVSARAGQELAEHQGVLERLRAAEQSVTPLGRSIGIIGFGAWVVGWLLGWYEFMIVAAACLGLVVVGLFFVLRRSSAVISLSVDPPRVTAGGTSAGLVQVARGAGRFGTSVRIEVPVGSGVATYDVSSAEHGGVHEEIFVIPTTRRGVIPVGPATVVRSDPLGLFQRMSSASEATELIVHPVTIGLAPFGTGLLRDLEGRQTRDLSTSDLAFHALREYAPGDDRRHIHWKSSAKMSAEGAAEGTRYLVRQYLETRRSAFCVIVDSRVAAYGDPEDFELALQVAGSILLRGARDGVPSIVVAGGATASGTTAHQLLDALSRAQLSTRGGDLGDGVGRSATFGEEVSVAVMVSGSESGLRDFDRASVRLGPDVRILGVRVVPGESPSLSAIPRGFVAQLGALTELPLIVSQELAA